MKIEAGRPRKIRGYHKTRTKSDARSWRNAIDLRTGFAVQMIKAAVPHTCQYVNCPWPNRTIEIKTPYLAVSHPDWNKRIGRQYVPNIQKFHPDCVPHEVRPLVRFVVPTPYLMTLVVNRDNVKSWRFTSVEAWRAAMDKHYPEMAERWWTSFNNEAVWQVGTDYHYSVLEYKPRPFERQR